MAKAPKKNEFQNEKKTEKKLFQKGGLGGPGRGHKKSKIQIDGDLLDAIEEVVRTGLGSDDLKDRLKAAGIGLRVQNLKGKSGK